MTINGTNGRDFVHVSGDGHGVPLHYKDKPLATNGLDSIDISQGGNDIVFSGAGNDTIVLGAQFTAADQIDGESDNDTVTLNGDYSGGVVFNATTMVNVENVILAAGHDYNFTTNDANTASLSFLLFDGTALGAANHLTLDASAETNGFVYAKGGAGDDVVRGGTHSNTYYMSSGGNDTVIGSTAGDNVFFGATLTAKDHFDGGLGIGFNEVAVEGDYSGGLKLGLHTFTEVDEFRFEAGYDYKITMNDGNVAVGATMEIDASDLLSANHLVFNGSAESDGKFNVLGGKGDDVFIGGAGNDTIQGSDGHDTITPGAGADIVLYSIFEGADASTGSTYDTVVGFDFQGADRFNMPGSVTGTDVSFSVGKLTTNHFDANLEDAVTGDDLLAQHAVLFTPDSGNLAGHTFLIIDANNADGYQAGEDYVIELVSAVHTGSLDTADFI